MRFQRPKAPITGVVSAVEPPSTLVAISLAEAPRRRTEPHPSSTATRWKTICSPVSRTLAATVGRASRSGEAAPSSKTTSSATMPHRAALAEPSISSMEAAPSSCRTLSTATPQAAVLAHSPSTADPSRLASTCLLPITSWSTTPANRTQVTATASISPKSIPIQTPTAPAAPALSSSTTSSAARQLNLPSTAISSGLQQKLLSPSSITTCSTTPEACSSVPSAWMSQRSTAISPPNHNSSTQQTATSIFAPARLPSISETTASCNPLLSSQAASSPRILRAARACRTPPEKAIPSSIWARTSFEEPSTQPPPQSSSHPPHTPETPELVTPSQPPSPRHLESPPATPASFWMEKQ